MIEIPTYWVHIFVSGDAAHAKQICQRHCTRHGLCVTIEPVDYVYAGGAEAGVRVGLINYGRFPTEPAAMFAEALELAESLRSELAQNSFSVVAPDRTVYVAVPPVR